MARGRPKKSKPATREVDAESLKKAIDEVVRQKANASSYVGMAGAAAKNAIELYGLDRTAFGYVTKLKRMESTKASAAIRSTIRYAFLVGLFDQFDAFSDVADELQEIVDAIRDNRPNDTGSDETVSALIN